jgi:hypothetical protein
MKREKPTPLVATTMYLALCVCVAVTIPRAAHAVKGHCEGDTHWQCTTYPTSQENGAWYDPTTGQWYNKSCRCQPNSGGSSGGPGSYGHAEIHKKNVPTVKPSGGIGPMSVSRRPAWIMRRAPMGVAAPPAALHRGPAFGTIR